jgi:hypothetical protein
MKSLWAKAAARSQVVRPDGGIVIDDSGTRGPERQAVKEAKKGGRKKAVSKPKR